MHTESVLKTRKDALMAKHVEGRESLHELDYIFRRREEIKEEQPARKNFNMMDANYLDQVGREIDEAENANKEKEDSPKDHRPTRSDLYEWNLRTNKEFDIHDDEGGVKERESEQFVNLRIGEVGGQRLRREADSQEKEGVVAAVGGVAEANNNSGNRNIADEENDADPLHDGRQDDFKLQREQLLSLIS